MTINYSRLKRIVFIYVSLPVLVFLAFYLRPIIAVPCLIVFFFALLASFRKNQGEDFKEITVNLKLMCMLFAVVLLWTFLGGLNGHWFQSSDWDCRNAIFRDLITHSWPVIYEKSNSALSYYFGHWLPVAAFAKVIYWIFGESVAWEVGQNLLWIWTTIGLFLLLLLILLYCRVNNKKQTIVVLVVFIVFSGMDIVGAFITQKIPFLLSSDIMHLEWWCGSYQFSSITTCLYWVFNQSVIPWLVVLCFLFEKSFRNYVFLATSCIACGAFPFVGLIVLMMVKMFLGLIEAIKRNSVRQFFENVFSLSNLLCLLFIIPVYFFFYIANNAISDTIQKAFNSSELIAAQENDWSTTTRMYDWFYEHVFKFSIFFMIEIGCYFLLLFREHKKDFIYYTSLISLILIPHFKIGLSYDFCARASIPMLFVVMVFCCDFLAKEINEIESKTKIILNLKTIILILVLLLGACTPLIEISRGIFYVANEKRIPSAYDPIYSFDNYDAPYNFSASDYSQKVFFKYIADR